MADHAAAYVASLDVSTQGPFAHSEGPGGSGWREQSSLGKRG